MSHHHYPLRRQSTLGAAYVRAAVDCPSRMGIYLESNDSRPCMARPRVIRVAFNPLFCHSDRVESNDLTVIDGAAAGAWITPRLGGEFGAVTLEIPKGFQAYARIFHPASDPAGRPVRWAEVAKMCGTIPHPEMQWHAILGLDEVDQLGDAHSPNNPYRPKWTGSNPPTGAMDLNTFDALCKILASHTVDRRRYRFGLCTIQGWEESFSAEELQPLLRLPNDRDFIILCGSLSAVDQIKFDWSGSPRVTFSARRKTERGRPTPASSSFWRREAPNLMWPLDHSSFVASEVDFDSTLVGGSATLIDAIVKSPELEAWQMAPDNSLAADADTVNVTSKDN